MDKMTKTEAIEIEIAELIKENGGSITPQQVVDFARDENTALHSKFEWDDTVAAENYRRDQARTILQSIVIADGKETPRVYLNVEVNSGRVYMPSAKVMARKHTRNQEVQAGISMMNQWLFRFGKIPELEHISSAVRNAMGTD